MEEVWTTPHIEQLQLSPDGGFFRRVEEDEQFDGFFGKEGDWLGKIRGAQHVAELKADGPEGLGLR